jgi:hypothetical protein
VVAEGGEPTSQGAPHTAGSDDSDLHDVLL